MLDGGDLTDVRSPMPPDRIEISGIEVFAHHGVYDEERERGQVFYVDLSLDLDLGTAGHTDDLSATVHYGELVERVHGLVSGERWDLIERVAQRVAEVVLEDDRIDAVRVTVHKPSAPVAVTVDDIAVSIERRR